MESWQKPQKGCKGVQWQQRVAIWFGPCWRWDWERQGRKVSKKSVLCTFERAFSFLRPIRTYSRRGLDGGVVTIARKELVLSGELGGNVLDSLLSDLGKSLSALVVSSRASAALVLKLVDDAGVLPADFGGETTQDGVSSVGTESEGAKGVGDDEALNLIKRRGDTLENL